MLMIQTTPTDWTAVSEVTGVKIHDGKLYLRVGKVEQPTSTDCTCSVVATHFEVDAEYSLEAVCGLGLKISEEEASILNQGRKETSHHE